MKSTSHEKTELANRNVTTFIPLTPYQIATLKVFKSTGWSEVSGREARKGSVFSLMVLPPSFHSFPPPASILDSELLPDSVSLPLTVLRVKTVNQENKNHKHVLSEMR